MEAFTVQHQFDKVIDKQLKEEKSRIVKICLLCIYFIGIILLFLVILLETIDFSNLVHVIKSLRCVPFNTTI